MKWILAAVLLYACGDANAPRTGDDEAPPRAECDGSAAGRTAPCNCDAGRPVVDDAGIPIRTEEDFVSFTYRNGSVPQGRWSTITVEPPGQVTFEDAAILQRKELDPAYYRMILDYVLSPAFVDAVRRPMNPNCPQLPDSARSLGVTWRNVGEQSVATGICGDPEESDHVYARLWVVIAALQDKHFTCEGSPGFYCEP
jgi:hypothetical protein